MITIENLRLLLVTLDFKIYKNVYSKHYADINATLKVDFNKHEIVYPERLTINERQTCNLKADENFVVLECVHRLLAKGYKPDHIELEPKWKLGHGASGGRADILIRDNAKKPLLIIECKTPGREFDKAWRNTLHDGAQLFSYAQQIPETQFLCLYCSDFPEGAVTYQSNIIAYRDNEKYLDDNPSFKGFKEPGDAKAKFAVWRDTYKLDYTTKGIFEENIQPYHIGKDKYTIDDLQSISADDQQKKYHEFATILRQHNVSGRENAFDKLVNLFLCKLVDEIENQKLEPSKQELKFYWKGVAYDSHFDLMDRLQQLYQAGMGKFLGESITYIDQSAVKNAMRFIRQNPDATQKAVWHLFLQQKFFTNNDFSFIDVHNEKLFYQNADVLLKLLKMWQDIRLTSDKGHNQFLGDMFEFFLDQGVKQSEGQYFTPMPICRFILMSLPLESLVVNSATPPKAIDYACGAGHFLTELALQLKPLVERHMKGDIAEYHRAIYGMEKEYRLSKVAKVSAFMYGQQEINICYGDALANRHAAFPEIRDNSFDLLVANPPFSVRGFLETLPEEERTAYTLADAIDKLDTNNSIETFFIERAKQLLKAGGVAGLILPASVLSNGGRIYTKAREILLQYFDIVAIAEFGSGTFGKTGTNTVTLFLRRKATTPDTAEHYRERVAEWFDNDDNQPVYKDAHLIDQYAAHIGTAAADYKTLLAGAPNAALLAHEIFVQYRKAFDACTEIVNLKKQKGFKAKPKKEQEAELVKRFVAFMQEIERDKLLHFVLANQQPNQVLIVKGPEEIKAKRQFIGYFWSDSKGDEGIKIIRDAQGHHLTPLYDETDRNNAAKLNRCIAGNFDGTLSTVPTELSEFAATVQLVDMLDFTRVTFEKQIVLRAKHSAVVQSKWPLMRLGDLVATIESGSRPQGGVGNITNGVYSLGGEHIHATSGCIDLTSPKFVPVSFFAAAKRGVLQAFDILICKDGALTGKIALLRNELAGTEAMVNEHVFILRTGNIEKQKFIFNYLYCEDGQKLLLANITGAAQGGLNSANLKDIKIPLPPLEIQQKLVSECEAVDEDVTTAQAAIDAARLEIVELIADTYHRSSESKRLQQICEIKRGRFSHRPRNEPRFFGGQYPFIQTGDVVRAVASKVPYTQTLNEEGLAVSKLFQPPVVLVTIAANIGDTAVLDYPACFTDSVVGLIPRDGINARFLELMMRAQKKHLNDIAPQMAQKNINIEILKPIKVPVQPLAQQKRLVAKVETLEKSIAEAQAIIAAATGLKQAIMKRHL